MAAKPDLTVLNPLSRCVEQAPWPLAMVGGTTRILSYANPAFCRLANKTEGELVGKPFHEALDKRAECLALLDRVCRSGISESHTEQDYAAPGPVFRLYTMWPVIADEPTVGVMIQVIETAPFHERTLAMNEALVIGSLRQHELTALAIVSNTQLQTEADNHRQRELDARMLTNEISHRIKNNLHVIGHLIGREINRAATPCVQGYEAMRTRIEAIAELYDLISQSSHGQTVALDSYLGEIAKTLSASLLGPASRITIEAKAESVRIDTNRAVPFGLLVNELVTNAIKHAFPEGKGSVVLSVRQTDDRIELDVADDGIGMKDVYSAKSAKRRGSDYVAIFVRQLGGTLVLADSKGIGTVVRIRFPALAGS